MQSRDLCGVQRARCVERRQNYYQSLRRTLSAVRLVQHVDVTVQTFSIDTYKKQLSFFLLFSYNSHFLSKHRHVHFLVTVPDSV